LPGNDELPVAADMNRDGVTDIGLSVPHTPPGDDSVVIDWYFLVSNVTPLTPPIAGSVYLLNHAFNQTPFSNDRFFTFGDTNNQPIVGNFDPPIGGAGGVVDATAPTVIDGTTSNTAINDNQTATPFSNVVLTDTDPGETYSVTVTLSAAANGTLSNLAGGSYDPATGVYTSPLGSSLAQTQSALRGLVFTPTPGQVRFGQAVVTNFTIRVNDSAWPRATIRPTSGPARSTGSPPPGRRRLAPSPSRATALIWWRPRLL